MTKPEFRDLRRMVVAHDADEENPCGWCDKRWAKVEAEVERVVGTRLMSVLAQRNATKRLRSI